MKPLSRREISRFQKTIWDYYKKHGRDLPWRPPSPKLRRDKSTFDPYKILVSEMMLQQTQVSRVFIKYPEFIKRFKAPRALALAGFREVLLAWSGLGYNRRAKFLHETAKTIVSKYGGKVPDDIDALTSLPGVGAGTAGAILAFAFNKPAVFIETNIRSVFIYHFFLKSKHKHGVHKRHSDILANVRMSFGQKEFRVMRRKIHDKEILPLIEQTLDKNNPREWYFALMDYGVMLKQNMPNPSRKSAHYTKQSPFKNSNRQVRGEILKLLAARGVMPHAELQKHIQGNKKFIQIALKELQKEKFIRVNKNTVRVST